MKFLLKLLGRRLRTEVLALLPRLLSSVLASRLQPATVRRQTAPAGRTPHRTIDGECRRIDARHNDLW